MLSYLLEQLQAYQQQLQELELHHAWRHHTTGQGGPEGGKPPLTLPPIATYAITSPETITFSVPSSVVVSRQAYTAWPPLTLLPTRGSAALLPSSSLLRASEAELRTNASTTLAVSAS